MAVFAAVSLHAQQQPPAPSGGSVDTEVTITGRDDAVIPIPEPGGIDDQPALPPLDPAPAAPVMVPPVVPPPGDVTVDAPPPP